MVLGTVENRRCLRLHCFTNTTQQSLINWACVAFDPLPSYVSQTTIIVAIMCCPRYSMSYTVEVTVRREDMLGCVIVVPRADVWTYTIPGQRAYSKTILRVSGGHSVK